MRQLTHLPERPRREQALAIRERAKAVGSANEMGQAWPCAPSALVRIYEIGKEWSIPAWLCPAAAVEMQARGWKLLSHRAPPFDDLACDLHRDAPCPPRPAR
jgi:hypothetical protein